MSLITDTFKRGSMGASSHRHGLASGESRDPIGFASPASTGSPRASFIDRVGLRRQAEQLVFTATRNGFRTATAAGRQFGKRRQRGAPGTRPEPPRAAAGSST